MPAPDIIAPEAPWHAGLRAARANLIPGLIVQAVMIATVLAYFYVDGVARFRGQILGSGAAY
ncbi:MAG: hypothetical protein WED15_07110 [Akkermansiaceae bacterium]